MITNSATQNIFTSTPPPHKTTLTASSAFQAESAIPSGKSYHVAAGESGASDQNNGLSSTFQGGEIGPWLTIQHAAGIVDSGDVIYLHAGVYYESGIRFRHSGGPGAPIALVQSGSGQVVLDGSRSRGNSSGIEFLQGQSYFVIQGLEFRNMPRSGITTDGNTTQPYLGLTILDCSFHDNGLSGMRLSAVEDFLIDHVEAFNNAYYGVEIAASEDGALSSSHGLVRTSSFHDQTGREGHGLAINQGFDISIQDSQAYHNRIHGFDLSDMPKRGEVTHDIIMERNFSYDNGLVGFSVNSDSHHVMYRRNIAWRNGAAWAGSGSASGFYCYEGCGHIEYDHNVSVGNTDGGFWINAEFGLYRQPPDSLLVFRNNIAFANGSSSSLDQPALVVMGEVWQVESSHNNWAGFGSSDARVVAVHLVGDSGEIFTSQQVDQGDFRAGDRSRDPAFIDLALPDFHLQPGSAMIDAGTDIGLPYCGVAPDLGAYEYCP